MPAGLLAHQPFDAMQTGIEPIGQHVVPDPPGAIGAIASGKAGSDPGDEATATPRSLTSLTASSLNSRLNLRLSIKTLQFQKHLNSVSSKPAATHLPRLPAGRGSRTILRPDCAFDTMREASIRALHRRG